MREIPLIGKYSHLSAIVDDEDFEYLSQFNWCGHLNRNGDVYAYGSSGAVVWNLMHRVIMGLEKRDPREVDHIHHKTLDNRRSELRIVSKAEQLLNQKRSGGASKYTGVSWHKTTSKWQCQVQINGKKVYIGVFDSEELAARTADVILVLTRGRFANLNFEYGGSNVFEDF